MKSFAKTRVTNNSQLVKGTSLLLSLLFVCCAAWHGFDMLRYPEHPKGTVQTRSGIAQRALKICTALNGSARLLCTPTLQSGHELKNSPKHTKRKIWVVLCEAGDQQLNMVFDDKSARLICLIMESSANRLSAHEMLPPVRTQKEAICVSVERLKTMAVLPDGAQIALRERPEAVYNKSMWEVNWLVRTADKKKPYLIKMVLNSKTGRPAYMVDLSERA